MNENGMGKYNMANLYKMAQKYKYVPDNGHFIIKKNGGELNGIRDRKKDR